MSERSLRSLSLSETTQPKKKQLTKNKPKNTKVGCTACGSSSTDSESGCSRCWESVSNSTCTDISIRRVCNPWANNCNPCNDNQGFCSQSILIFYAMITPLTDVNTLNGQNTVGFTVIKTGKSVTLQWEPFSGRITTNGITSLNVLQSLTNLPAYIIYNSVFLQYKSVGRLSLMEINPSPSGSNGNVSFYLNPDQSNTGVAANDIVSIPGGSVSWVIE